MQSGDAVAHKIWNGSIFTAFRLADNERLGDGSNTPPPFYLQVPRITYFTLVLEKVIRSLQNFVKSGSTENDEEISTTKPEPHNQYWLSHNGIPLRWHYPVGVLFDLYSSSAVLPWEITIHFKDYPSNVLLAPPVNRAAVEAFFVATLKEADQLKHRGRGGSGPVFDDIQSEEKCQLLNGFTQHRFDLFWSINKRFMQGAPIQSKAVAPGNAHISKDGDKGDGQCTQIVTEDAATLMTSIGAMKAFRHCPFRLYFSPLNLNTVSPTKGFIQTLISPFNESDSTPVTFSDIIIALFGRIRAKNFHPEEFTFKVHGVEIPPETPAQWMCEWMAYPDNFVHIVARKREE
ncbi:unnamed protein product [Hymenolepis diminuta]|uniref:Autophagy protein 5 n=1 Tax=Hymenolepis diminuta TaxID=6216 RepID=A0A564ZD21_HYMDI|nr:unnamed protein product [Hymenolepis diminuta]